MKIFHKTNYLEFPADLIYSSDLDVIVPCALAPVKDLIPFAEDLWDSADRKTRHLFLEQCHGEKAAAFPADTGNKSGRRSLSDILPPFVFDPERRAQLRADLDTRYARLYGLTRDDLMGVDYPSETFRVLKDNEIKACGEYRTQRLTLAAQDREEGL